MPLTSGFNRYKLSLTDLNSSESSSWNAGRRHCSSVELFFCIETNAVAVPIKPSERSHPVSENRREEERKNDMAVVLDNKYGRAATLYQWDEYLLVDIRFSLR